MQEGRALIMDLLVDGLVTKWPSKREARKFTKELINAIGMTPIEPFVYTNLKKRNFIGRLIDKVLSRKVIEVEGPSFYQMLAESHLNAVLITDYMMFPEKPLEVWVNLSSCKWYDAEFALKFIVKRLGMYQFQHQVIPRGIGIRPCDSDKIPPVCDFPAMGTTYPGA